jgi:hypothetical protein
MVGFWHKLKNFLIIDSGGWRAFIGVVVGWFLVAAAVAVARAYAKGCDGQYTFDWHLFWVILAALGAINLASRVFDSVCRGGHVLHPIHGFVFRGARKHETAAVLRKIATVLPSTPADPKLVSHIVTDVLGLIVLHVRDVRGNHDPKRTDVFASLLMEDGDDLVVVARDAQLHSRAYERPIPERHKRTGMLAAAAFGSKSVAGTGDMLSDFPDGPRNKPYRSILAIPVFGTKDDQQVLAVVSIDSSRPYFFESFKRGLVERSLETGLRPYLGTLALALECLVSRDKDAILRALSENPVTLNIKGAV